MYLKKYIGSAFGSKQIHTKTLLKNEGIEDNLAEKIVEKTGAENIFRCSDEENSLSLSFKAYNNLTNIESAEFKNLIYVTENSILNFPGNAFLFSSEKNINENTKLYDINAGCSGFVDALNIGRSLDGNTLIICSETYSKGIKSFNRSISPIFSDGSTAFFLDKKKLHVEDIISGFKRDSFKDLCKSGDNDILMNGPSVFSFASSKVLVNLESFINKHSNKNIKKIYLHQGSGLVCDFFKKKLEKYNIDIPSNIKERGNSVSSTIPILIQDDNYNFKKNDYFIVCGFGVGLNFSIGLVHILDD